MSIKDSRCALLLSMSLVLSCFPACGSKTFEGLLTPEPEWVFTDLSSWDRSERANGQQFYLFGRGASQGQLLITNRRAIAEREAVRHAKERFTESYREHLAAAHYAADYLQAISELPWEQIAITAERYFDAQQNTQHVLVLISQERLDLSIRFEQSADPSRAALWTAIADDLTKFYQSRSQQGEPSQTQAPSSL